MKIAIIGGVPQSLTRFRGLLIERFVSHGHEVMALAGDANAEEFTPEIISADLAKIGVEFVCYPLQRKGANPFSDLRTLYFFYRFFKREEIDLVLAYTVKPIIWGGLASRFRANTKFFALVTGLGEQFKTDSLRGSLVQLVLRHLYSTSFAGASKVIFQNKDDRDRFLNMRITSFEKTRVVAGSGVDLADFRRQPMPDGPPVFVCVARLLEAKGIRHYVAAAKSIKQQNPSASFLLAGEVAEGRGAIALAEVQEWHSKGLITFLGRVRDIPALLSRAHVFVLPSFYGEGIPRTILEALAVGRPILTTDNVGCREAVVDGNNGKLVEPRSDQSLIAGMQWFLENQEQWLRMASASRQLAETRFDVEKVNDELVSILEVV